MWRTVNQNFSSNVGTEVDEGLDIFLGFNTNDLIGMSDVESFRLCQQPMEANNLDPVLFGCLPNGFPSLRRNFGDRVCQRAGRDLTPIIPIFFFFRMCG